MTRSLIAIRWPTRRSKRKEREGGRVEPPLQPIGAIRPRDDDDDYSDEDGDEDDDNDANTVRTEEETRDGKRERGER